MTDEKYTSFIEKNLESCYYDLADRMMLLPIMGSLLENWDKNLNGRDKSFQELLKKQDEKIKDLTNHISELIEKNNLISNELNLYGRVKKINVSRGEIDISVIKRIIDRYFDCDTDRKTRKREIAYARQMGMYFSKELTQESLATIGREFGDKDHATVLHAIRTINNLTFYPKTRKHINELKIIFDSIINEKEINKDEIDRVWAY
jgi:chromosomal replication initiation ATPase DnaA